MLLTKDNLKKRLTVTLNDDEYTAATRLATELNCTVAQAVARKLLVPTVTLDSKASNRLLNDIDKHLNYLSLYSLETSLNSVSKNIDKIMSTYKTLNSGVVLDQALNLGTKAAVNASQQLTSVKKEVDAICRLCMFNQPG